MRVEMLEGEAMVLREMLGGDISPACEKLFLSVRRKLLLGGHAYTMSKETLALIATLTGAVGEPVERPEPKVHETNGHAADPTPDDELTEAEREAVEARYKNGDSESAYKGNRIKWETEFKSTPKTPIAKLEKGRPITYVSPDDGVRYGARFIRVLPKNKKKCSIMSSQMKKPFSIDISLVEITDLSPPSTEPLPVQI